MFTQTSAHHEYEKQYFDQGFKQYERYSLDNWRVSFLRRIFVSLKIGTASRDLYLDIGVGGSGYTVIEATRRQCRSVGIDISLEGIRKARQFARSELGERSRDCGFIVCLAENLPFKNQTFTKISSIAVLEHVPNDKQAIEELSRVIKLQGDIFITVPNSYKRIFPIFWLPYYIWDKRIGHLRHYEAESLSAEFQCAGLITRRILYSGHLTKVVQYIISWLSSVSGKSFEKIWWKLEETDLKIDSPTGLQLTLLVRKVE
jgi:ubiquinone/menaquinone biosynthesis C-methylase UbiE